MDGFESLVVWASSFPIQWHETKFLVSPFSGTIVCDWILASSCWHIYWLLQCLLWNSHQRSACCGLWSESSLSYLNRCFVLQNFRIAKNSGIMFSAYWKYCFIWHSSEYETLDISQTTNKTFFFFVVFFISFGLFGQCHSTHKGNGGIAPHFSVKVFE